MSVVPGATEVDGVTTHGYNLELVVWGAGHSQGTGIPKRTETPSRQYAFLARALGLALP